MQRCASAPESPRADSAYVLDLVQGIFSYSSKEVASWPSFSYSYDLCLDPYAK